MNIKKFPIHGRQEPMTLSLEEQDEWRALTPQERWKESEKLWQNYLEKNWFLTHY